MKKIILSLLVACSSVATYAQHSIGAINIQPKIGINIANISEENSNPRIGIVAGIEAEYQLTDLLSLSGALLYSQQGNRNKIDTEILAPNKVYSETNYLNIPIMTNVYVIKGLAVKLGLQPSIKISSNSNINTVDISIPKYIKIDKANNFDLSIPVGLSYEINHLQLDARYNWGITNIYKYENAKNSVFQITLGYKFSI